MDKNNKDNWSVYMGENKQKRTRITTCIKAKLNKSESQTNLQ